MEVCDCGEDAKQYTGFNFSSFYSCRNLSLTQIYITASAVSCNEGYYCATQRNFVGCCASSSCSGIVTKCYDILGDICNASCRQNLGNLVWLVEILLLMYRIDLPLTPFLQVAQPYHIVPLISTVLDPSDMAALGLRASKLLFF
jgi:hypothetical protein